MSRRTGRFGTKTAVMAGCWLVLIWAVLGAMSGPRVSAAESNASSPLEAEREAATARLIADGYQTTRGYSYGEKTSAGPTRSPFFVPNATGELTFRVWNHAGSGKAEVRVLDGTGRVVWKARGGTFDRKRRLNLEAGKYVLEVDTTSASNGAMVVGLKGRVVWECGNTPRVTLYPPDGSHFEWPYFLYAPERLTRPRLLVLPNNTGFGTDTLEIVQEHGRCSAAQAAPLADRLGVAVLIPLFPRPSARSNFYTHALDRDALLEKSGPLRRLDLQLLGMIDDARQRLATSGLEVDPRVWMVGFSASGMFVNRFTMLHPERVAVAAIGSPGGWPIAPVAQVGDAKLRYPIGIDDVESLTGSAVSLEALKSVRQLFFLGDQDTNDSVVFRDGYEAEDEALIFKHFGDTPVHRWGAAEALYRQVGADARFMLFPGVGHQVNPAMQQTLMKFFLEQTDMTPTP